MLHITSTVSSLPPRESLPRLAGRHVAHVAARLAGAAAPLDAKRPLRALGLTDAALRPALEAPLRVTLPPDALAPDATLDAVAAAVVRAIEERRVEDDPRDDAPLDLPTDRPRGRDARADVRHHAFTLPPDLRARLDALADAEGAPLPLVLLACYQVLLHRHAARADDASILGVRVSPDAPFREHLARVREAWLGGRLASRGQLAFTFDAPPAPAPDAAELALALRAEGGIVGDVAYRADLLDAATVERMMGHYATLLDAVAGDATVPVSRLPLLTPPERAQVLHAWGRAAPAPASGETLTSLFEAQAARTPDAVAVTFQDRALTYRDLDARANRLARHLRTLGVGPDVLVGLCVERSLDMIVGVLGVLKAGGAYLPLDPAYPADRLRFMMEDAKAPVLVTQEACRDAVPLREDSARVVLLDGASAAWDAGPDTRPEPAATRESLAYVIYTSGSTGRPKGVMVEHRQVVRLFSSTRAWFGFGPSDVWTMFHSFAFDFSVWEMWGALLHGGRLVVVPSLVAKDAAAFLALLKSEGVTVLNQTPSAFRVLTRADEAAGGGGLALREVIFGGEALEPATLRGWFERHGDASPRLVNMYGITETTVHVTYRPLTRADAERGHGSPIGRPIPDLELLVLDAHLQPVPVGVPGELHVGGAGLARGYLHRPDLTRERFIPHPHATDPDARLYRTGDLARLLPDGSVDYLGRIDHQVKIRGFRIELGEIESALVRHPDVREAVVLAREDAPGDKRLVAYVVPAPGAAPGAAALRDALSRALPEHMVPAAFVLLDRLPLTANGKTDRKALPAPDATRPDLGAPAVPPRTPTESTLRDVWTEVLRLDGIGVEDDFFALGGHSLLATQVVARVATRLGVELSLVDLFEAPTIAAFARVVDAAERRGDAPRIPRLPRAGDIPLSLNQERTCFLEEISGDAGAYHSQSLVRLEGDLDAGVLERVLQEVVRRHEIFRTSFPVVNGKRVQVIHDAWDVRLRVVDVPRAEGQDARAALDDLLRRELTRPFRVGELPLVRWTLYRLAPREHVLLHHEHHLVHDGWSFNVFLRELVALYTAFRAGEPSPLPPLEIQWADFARWQRAWMEGPQAKAQLAHYRERLAGSGAPLELPFDRPRPARKTYRGSKARVELPLDLSEAVRETSRRLGSTLFMTTFAAFAALLHRASGSDDINVGSGIANRRWRETESLIGMVVNTVVLRVDLAGDPTFRDLVDRVRREALAAYANQDVPIERVVEELRPERSLSHNPLFQVAWSFHDAPLDIGEIPGVKLDVVEAISNESSKFDINVVVVPRAEQRLGAERASGPHGITLIWEYSTDVFDAATTERMIRRFQAILRAVVADPDVKLSDIPLLDADEERALLAWGVQASPSPPAGTVHDAFATVAARAPDAPAVLGRAAALSYAELDARANRLARHLRRLGVRAGDAVGLSVEGTPDFVLGALAILKAGAAYLPLDPAYPEERLRFMLEDGHARVLVTQAALADRVGAGAARVLRLDADAADVASEDATPPPSDAGPESPACIFYTSGSTGRAKGVVVPHRAVLRLALDDTFVQLTPEDRVAQASTTSFDAATFEVWSALLHGARVVEVLKDVLLSPSALEARIRSEGITTMFVTTALFHRLAAESPRVFHGMRNVLFGGEACDPRRVRDVLRAGPPERLLHVYGPTESTTFATWHLVRDVPPDATTVPIGRPIGETRAYVLDPRGRLAPTGVPGELVIGGAGVALGYLDRPDLTAERFVPDPYAPRDRAYRTGDLARWRADGTLEFVGRVDDQVKIRGFRIEPGEVQARLAAHPGLREAVVVAREDAPGEKRLVAYVVPRGADAPAPADLRAFLARDLPEYMVPSAFVALDALPLNPNGKVEKRALPAPEADATGTARAYVAPRDAAEELLSTIWADVLGVERVGVHDHFFERGGHSLLAMQMVARLRDALGLDVPLDAVFASPTLEALARDVVRLLQQAEERALAAAGDAGRP